MNRIGFDNDQYVKLQSQNIRDRISQFGGKLYLEFGGKLYDDYHASRVLPGFAPDNKLKMLEQLKERAEIVIVISAEAIEQQKIRGDLGITYEADALRLKDVFEKRGFYVSSIVIRWKSMHRSAPDAVGSAVASAVHLMLRVSLYIVRSVVEHGQCSSVNISTLPAVVQVQPLAMSMLPICALDALSVSVPAER